MNEIEVVQNWLQLAGVVTAAFRNVRTCNTREKLSGKALDLAVRKWNERIALQEIEDALSEQVCDNADMSSEIEASP